MNFTSYVNKKGQVTIPALIRRKLGIERNTKILFELKVNNEVSLKPIADFFALKGSVKSCKPFDIDTMEKSRRSNSIKEL